MIKQYERELKELKEKMIRAEAFAEKVPCFRDFILKNKITGTEGYTDFASYYKKIPFNWRLSRARYISGTNRNITNYQLKHDKYLFSVYINPLTLFGEHEYFGLERVLKESTVFFFDKLNDTFYVEDEHIEGFLEALNNWYMNAVEELKRYKVNKEIEELKSRLFELTEGKED
jgi:hypothetical protein